MKTMKLTGFSLAIALSVGFFASCSDDDSDGGSTLPPIGGYNSADEVGAADLLAYWPLNGNGNESKSATAPTTSVGTSWTNGIKGQGVNLTAGYMQYPSIASLAATMNAFTVSAWVKVYNNKTATNPGSASVIVSLSRPTEWEGNINLYAETGQRPSVNAAGAVNDSIIMKGSFRSSVSGGEGYANFIKLDPWMVDENLVTPGKHVANANKTAGVWTQAVFTWDGATNKLIIYSNGVKISSPSFEVRGTNTSLVPDLPTAPVIGAFANRNPADVWNLPMTGQIDEIRIWKKALSQADIGFLYELEKAGR